MINALISGLNYSDVVWIYKVKAALVIISTKLVVIQAIQ